jgi:hypothetical protein
MKAYSFRWVIQTSGLFLPLHVESRKYKKPSNKKETEEMGIYREKIDMIVGYTIMIMIV